MIKKYIEMKKKEIQLKLTFYKYANGFLENKKDLYDLLYMIYISLKNEPIEELKNKFIESLARIIHETTSRGK